MAKKNNSKHPGKAKRIYTEHGGRAAGRTVRNMRWAGGQVIRYQWFGTAKQLPGLFGK